MRLRTRDTSRYPAPPEELADRCWVEEWVTPDEKPPRYWTLTFEDWAQAQAWRRWKNARAAWFSEHGVPRHLWCDLIPSRRPVWARDLPED